MKKILILSIVLTLNIHAQNLSQILESLQTSSKYKSLKKMSDADIAQNELFATYKAPSIGASISEADAIPRDAKDGVEYSFGISQEIRSPFSSNQRDEAVIQTTNAIKQETKHALHIFQLDVISAYYNSCVSKQMQEKSLVLYTEQSQRYKQFKKAYELGEISKKDLLFNKLDLVKLQQNVSLYERSYLAAFSLLQEKIDSLEINSLSCEDLIEPSSSVVLHAIEENGELKALEYKKNAANSFYKVHDAAINAVEYELLYEKELETRRYTFGLKIPLGNFGGEKEKLKAQKYALSSSLAHEKEYVKAQIQNYSKVSVKKLKVLHEQYEVLKNEVLPLNEELTSLSKSALLEGEGNILEYLDATRSYALNALEMLEIKKTYYTELFTLYKIADIEYGEKICKN
ncbi:MAG: TolC family protein [Sulfurimonas sp.]|nr:TolC family protein [Sulfurimonas sp.]MDQ7059758.1 TolC family protein [Sulfurimonas sp.]